MLHKNTTSEELSIDGVRSPDPRRGSGRTPQDRRTRDFSHGSNISRSLAKVTSVGLLLLLIFVGASSAGSTVSYFSDLETSLNNFFQADPLDFTVVVASSSPIDMSHGEQMIVPVMTPGADSEPIQYFVQAHMVGGDSALCSAIQLLGTAPFVYDAPLLSLSTGTSTETGPWALTFSLPPSARPALSASCSVDLIYRGWDARVAWGQGYSDEEHVLLAFSVSAPPAEAGSSSAGSTLTAASATSLSDDSSQGGSSTPAFIQTTDATTDSTSSPQATSTPATSTTSALDATTTPPDAPTAPDVTPPQDPPPPPPPETPAPDAPATTSQPE